MLKVLSDVGVLIMIKLVVFVRFLEFFVGRFDGLVVLLFDEEEEFVVVVF